MEFEYLEIGSTGLEQFSGYVSEDLNPKLRGTQGVREYRKMRDNDATVGAALFVIESLFRQIQFRVEPASEDPRAIFWQEFVDDCFEDMEHTFDEFISEVLSMLTYGWSYHEIVYKLRKDRRIGIRKIPIRGQDTLLNWKIADHGDILGMYQLSPPRYVNTFLPTSKCVLFRTTALKNNPEGRSILRNAYNSYIKLTKIEDIEMTGIERDLVGYPVLQVPLAVMAVNATPEAKALREKLEKQISRIRRDEDEGCLIPTEVDQEGKPTGYKLGLLQGPSKRTFDTDPVIRRYQHNIARTMLAEFVMLGQDAAGSFALSENKTKMFSLAMGSFRDNILATINRVIIPRLMRLNGVSEEFWPHMTGGDIDTPSLTELSTYVVNLANAGVIEPGPNMERRLLQVARLPEEEVVDDVSVD